MFSFTIRIVQICKHQCSVESLSHLCNTNWHVFHCLTQAWSDVFSKLRSFLLHLKGQTKIDGIPNRIHVTGLFTYIFHTNQPNVGKIYHTWILWVLFWGKLYYVFLSRCFIQDIWYSWSFNPVIWCFWQNQQYLFVGCVFPNAFSPSNETSLFMNFFPVNIFN